MAKFDYGDREIFEHVFTQAKTLWNEHVKTEYTVKRGMGKVPSTDKTNSKKGNQIYQPRLEWSQ